MIQKYNENGYPNIIYILADDMGYGDISCLNPDSKLNTSNIDQIANEGMIFTDAHSSSAVCTPSRYSILTGRYNWRSTLKSSVLGGFSPSLIEDGRLTVASLLRERSYKTACIGKWHLGLDWERTNDLPEAPDFGNTEGVNYEMPIKKGPLNYGFDYFYGISASLDMPPYVYIENDKVKTIPVIETENNGKEFWRRGPTAADFKHEEVLMNLLDKVTEKIDEWKEEKFFIYFPLTAPHTPILPIKQFIGKSKTNSYGDFVLMCDYVVGEITQKIKERGIEKDTIIIYTSDNGCSPMADYEELKKYNHNPSYIFRGHKADIYEGGHRIPLIVKWPGKITSGTISNEQVCLSDFIATVAEIVNYDIPDNAAEDSVSNLPIWLNREYDKPLREAIVHHSIDGSFSIRSDKWKLELCPGSGGWSQPKPGEEAEGAPRIQLYDLSNDISEKRNIYDKYPEVVLRLKDLLCKYIKEGRSTKGVHQKNTGPEYWEQLWWMDE